MAKYLDDYTARLGALLSYPTPAGNACQPGCCKKAQCDECADMSVLTVRWALCRGASRQRFAGCLIVRERPIIAPCRETPPSRVEEARAQTSAEEEEKYEIQNSTKYCFTSHIPIEHVTRLPGRLSRWAVSALRIRHVACQRGTRSSGLKRRDSLSVLWSTLTILQPRPWGSLDHFICHSTESLRLRQMAEA